MTNDDDRSLLYIANRVAVYGTWLAEYTPRLEIAILSGNDDDAAYCRVQIQALLSALDMAHDWRTRPD